MACTARQEKEMKRKYENMKYDKNLPPIDQLRAYVLARGVNSLKSLNRVFKRVDQEKNNKINLKEFQNALHYCGIYVDAGVEKSCFESMDRSGDGVVDLDEFIIALRPPMNNARLNLVHQAFHKLDKDKSGVITIEDLKGVYSPAKHPKYLSGEWTEDMVFREFLNSFDTKDADGKITMDDFENYYAAVSASVDSDAYFDLMMRKAWKL